MRPSIQKWVDDQLGLTDYQAKLSAGEEVVIFDFPRDAVTVTWLRQLYGGGCEVQPRGLPQMGCLPGVSVRVRQCARPDDGPGHLAAVAQELPDRTAKA